MASMIAGLLSSACLFSQDAAAAGHTRALQSCDLAGLGAQTPTPANQAGFLVCLFLNEDPTSHAADVALAEALLTQPKVKTKPQTLTDWPRPVHEVMGLMYNAGTFSTSTRQAFGLDAMDDPTFQNAIATVMLGNGVSAYPDLQAYLAQNSPITPRQLVVGEIMDLPEFAAAYPILAFDMQGRIPITTAQLVQDGTTGPVSVTSAAIKGGNTVNASFAVSPAFTGQAMIAYLLVLSASQTILASQPLHAYVQAGASPSLSLSINLSDVVPPGSYTLGVAVYAEGDEGPRLLWTSPQPVVEKPVYKPLKGSKAQFSVSYAVPYGTDPAQVMDILQPKSPAGPLHAILMMHGGGLVAGTRATMAEEAESFADAGWVVANIGYRLTRYEDPTTLWPAALNDARAALAFLQANAATYGINPASVCAGGDSAGAQIAIWLGSDAEVSCVADNSGPSDFTYAPIMVGGPSPWYDGDWSGSIKLAGKAIGWPEQFGGATYEPANMAWLQAFSAIGAISSASAPAYVTAGYYDNAVGWAEGEEYFQTLTSAQVPNVAINSYCGGHVFAGCTANGHAPSCTPSQGGAPSCDSLAILQQEVGWASIVVP